MRRSPRVPVAGTLAVIAIAAGACGAPPPASEGPTITEVDGVRVVESPAPQWAEADRWRLSAEPEPTIGVATGEAAEMLTNPRRPVRLSDGRIVIPDGTNEVRYFDAEGNHLHSTGREGEGPCEFGFIGHAYRAADDSVVVADLRFPRFLLFDAEGRCAATPQLEPHGLEYTRATLEGRFADGTLLARAVERPTRGLSSDTRIRWRPMPVFRYRRDGAAPELLVELRGWQEAGFEGQLVFASRSSLAAGGDRFAYADGSRFEVEVYGADGALLQHVRRRESPAPVTNADLERWIATSRRNMDAFEGDTSSAEFRLENLVVPEAMPAIRNLLIDYDGNVWAERHQGLAHTLPVYYGPESEQFTPGPGSWDVYGADGIWLGTVEVPAGQWVAQVGTEHVLTTGEDDAGVQRVRVYRLIKPGR